MHSPCTRDHHNRVLVKGVNRGQSTKGRVTSTFPGDDLEVSKAASFSTLRESPELTIYVRGEYLLKSSDEMSLNASVVCPPVKKVNNSSQMSAKPKTNLTLGTQQFQLSVSRPDFYPLEGYNTHARG
jgi:hypothetical protein